MSSIKDNYPPPYYAIICHTPPAEANAVQFADCAERLVGMAAAEPGFIGIDRTVDDSGFEFTVCYWSRATAVRLWQRSAARKLPPHFSIDDFVAKAGIFWPWLHDVFQARKPDIALPIEYGSSRRSA
jgi:hypothetical protein